MFVNGGICHEHSGFGFTEVCQMCWSISLAIRTTFLNTEDPNTLFQFLVIIIYFTEGLKLLLERGFQSVLLWKPVVSVIIRGSCLLTYSTEGSPRVGGWGSIPVFLWKPRVLVNFQVGSGPIVPSESAHRQVG